MNWTRVKGGSNNNKVTNVPSLSCSTSDYSISSSRRTTLTNATSPPLPTSSSVPLSVSVNLPVSSPSLSSSVHINMFSSLPLPASSSSRSTPSSTQFEIEVVVALLAQLEEIKKPKNDLWSVIEIMSPKDRENGSKNNPFSVFITQIERIVTGLDDQRSKLPSSTWASLFCKRSVKCKDLLSHDRSHHFHRILSYYVEAIKRKDEKEDMPSISLKLKIAEKILDFFATHEVDPDSVLIGLPPSSEALLYVRQYIDLTLVTPFHSSPPSPTSSSSSSSSLNMLHTSASIANGMSSGSRPLPPSYQQLIAMMMEWSLVDNESTLRENMQSMCSTFRGVSNIQKGDIAVVYVTTSFQDDDGFDDKSLSVMYGRYTGSRKNGLFEFFLSPDENKRTLVEGRHVYPITPHMKDMIRDLSTINILVQHPADQFEKILKGSILK